MKAWLLTFALACLTSSAALAADPGLNDIPTRVELHPIQSLTLSDQQFLEGDKAGGTQVTIAGQLRLPGGTGPSPVVVMMHGSGGPGPNLEVWSRELNAMGIATFLIDGFTGRGLVSVSTDQARLGRLNFILDIYRSLEMLAKHPRLDKGRIALIGFSRGGQAALYASLKRFHKEWNSSGVEFAAYIPFYPDCMTTFLSDTDVSERPIRIFHGSADDYNPAPPCRAFVERLKSAGRDVAMVEFPDTHHSFDNPLGSTTPVQSARSQTVRRCTIREEPKGRLINTATSEPFTYQDTCVQLGPHLGANPAAAEESRKAVKALLRGVFKLD